MRTNRPRRLRGVSYVGYQRYFLTTCTAFRRAVFVEAAFVEGPLAQVRQTATQFEFEVLAYCFIPDHLHLLVTARSELADLPHFMKRFKQLTGFAYRQSYGEALWQPGYHERILRDDEATVTVVRYVLENPVRAGLTRAFGEYAWAGSDVYDGKALISAWDQQT